MGKPTKERRLTRAQEAWRKQKESHPERRSFRQIKCGTTEDELEAVKAYAEALHVSVSDLIRAKVVDPATRWYFVDE